MRRLGVTAEAWYQLARAALVVRNAARNARTVRDGLCLRPGRSDRACGLEIARAVARASRFHLKPMACLERSLATLWMLRGRGIAAALRIGCRQQGSTLEFHAWVVDECGGVLAGQGHESSFLPMMPEASAAGAPHS
jgi:hypothetical protein